MISKSHLVRIAMPVACSLVLAGCGAANWRQRADEAASRTVAEKQQEALGRVEPFTVSPAEKELRQRLLLGQHLPMLGPVSLGSRHLPPVSGWPEENAPPGQTDAAGPADLAINQLTLADALRIAAGNSREYQASKEEVFKSALALDLERHAFASTFAGLAEGKYENDRETKGSETEGVAGSITGSVARTLKNGMTITAMLGLDLVRMLTPGHASGNSLFGDASITIPLLRGAGRDIAAEPLTQAERDALYAVWTFERFKQQFAVKVVDSYLAVLQAANQLANQEENYKGLIASSRRAERLAEAGKLPQVQVDQAVQSELRARDRLTTTRLAHGRALDQFKILLGLPTDASITLDRDEFARLAGQILPLTEADKAVDDPEPAIRIALANRLDSRVKEAMVEDAQRRVVVAADRLRPELTLFGAASVGSRRDIATASSGSSSRLDPGHGIYSGLLTLDLPFDRTAEAIAYRDSYIELERAVRTAQQIEDQIKLEVRNSLRDLEQARTSLVIQERAVKLAERRVRGSELMLEAGRSQMRDLLDSRDSLLVARNALTAAMVSFRLAELSLRRDTGELAVGADGLFKEKQ